ncbi:MAG: glycosyltransferase [Sphingobacteriales bacterium]|nr:MAG: glycosyltransferase [Sphingobacteriales bacterium]TAF82305.1 MAG: glycosyltransferase [Sphingobacteriales bacterium]
MNKLNPTISVLMPVYNGEKYLKEAINSILNQSFKDFEFIIINDGSTDSTEEIILSYTDPRIVYVKNEVNLHLIKTLNKGIDLSKGKYIARMDADDISIQNRFEQQIKIFNQYTEVDIVNCQYFLLTADGKSYRNDRTSIIINTEAVKYISIFQTMIQHPTVMIKAELMKLNKYKDNEDVKHIEDFELWNRLFENKCNSYIIEEHLLFYRVNPASINNTKGAEQNLKMNKLTENILSNQYNFKINQNALKLLQGDFNTCSYNLLKKIDFTLICFFKEVNKKHSISVKVFNDMLFWQKHKIFTVCIKSISKVNFVNKLGIIMFLVSKILWLKDARWRAKLKEIILDFRNLQIVAL